MTKSADILVGMTLIVVLLMHCTPSELHHSRHTKREITRYFNGSGDLNQLSSPLKSRQLYYSSENETSDPATGFIRFAVVDNERDTIVCQDRRRGVEIRWIDEKTLSIITPGGILNEQDANTSSYLIDIESGERKLDKIKADY